MTITLHKYIARDILKTFILASVGLTVILSLGSVLQPVQEYGVSPKQAMLLILYFMPVVLTFVMPIAAIFSAALTYGRLASDNELAACRASGISITAMMLAAAMLAVIVAGSNLLLNFYAVPYFINKTEQSVKANVRNIVFRSIEKQGSYHFEAGSDGASTYILADRVNADNDILQGVNILQVKSGRPKLISVSQANVDFESDDNYNYLSAIAEDVYQADNSGVIYSQKLPIKGKFAPLLLDEIRFKKLSELKRIRENLLLFNPISEQADKVLVRLRSELLAQQIREKSNDSQQPFYQLNSEKKIVLISAAQSRVGKEDNVIRLSNAVVYEYDRDDPDTMVNKWEAPSASLDINEQWTENTWTLLLDNAVWTDNAGVTGLPVSYSLRGFYTPNTITQRLSDNKLEVIENVTLKEKTERLQSLRDSLSKLITETKMDLTVEVNTRVVFGLGCIPLVLCGAFLGVIHKGGHTLTSFGLSVIPAAILAVFIIMGRNLTKNIIRVQGGTGELGILLMWSGLMALLILLLILHRKLVRS